MQNQIPNILNWFNTNQGLAQWLTAFVAGIAVIYTIKEFFLKRRPYIDIEIEYAEISDKNGGGWHFFAKLINKGTYPGIAQINNAELRIGDEAHKTTFKNKIVLSTGESKKVAHIGHINKNGINKILGHEYRTNRVEIEIEVASAEISSKKLRFLTKVVFEVVVAGEKPEFLLVEENFT